MQGVECECEDGRVGFAHADPGRFDDRFEATGQVEIGQYRLQVAVEIRDQRQPVTGLQFSQEFGCPAGVFKDRFVTVPGDAGDACAGRGLIG